MRVQDTWTSSPLRPSPRGHLRRMRGPGARSHKETLSCAHTVCVCVLSRWPPHGARTFELEVGITILPFAARLRSGLSCIHSECLGQAVPGACVPHAARSVRKPSSAVQGGKCLLSGDQGAEPWGEMCPAASFPALRPSEASAVSSVKAGMAAAAPELICRRLLKSVQHS